MSRSFEFTILGCSGGPICGKTCSFLLKPIDISFQDIITDTKLNKNCMLALDAGTGLTSLLDILNDCENSEFNTANYLLNLYKKSKTSSIGFKNYTHSNQDIIAWPFTKDFLKTFKNQTNLQVSLKILNSISSYLITHSHFDHILGLIINSPVLISELNSESGKLPIYGLSQTIESLKDHVFNGTIWPNLMGFMDFKVLNPTANTTQDNVVTVNDFYNVETFELSHGSELIKSSCFLVTDVAKDRNLLVFGDLESDLISGKSLNMIIWERVSDMIINQRLSGIVIECSSIDKPIDVNLYGHMTPSHLIYEFLKLRKCCIDRYNKNNKSYKDNSGIAHDDDYYKSFKYQPLDQLKIIIIHVKETLDKDSGDDPRMLVLNELNELNQVHRLGICFTIGLPGLSYVL